MVFVRCLRSASVSMTSLWLSFCLALQAACQKYGLSNAAALEELEVLLSFTVPLSAADGVRAHAQSQWVSGLHSSVECQTSEGVWGGIHVVCEETTQRMQL